MHNCIFSGELCPDTSLEDEQWTLFCESLSIRLFEKIVIRFTGECRNGDFRSELKLDWNKYHHHYFGKGFIKLKLFPNDHNKLSIKIEKDGIFIENDKCIIKNALWIENYINDDGLPSRCESSFNGELRRYTRDH